MLFIQNRQHLHLCSISLESISMNYFFRAQLPERYEIYSTQNTMVHFQIKHCFPMEYTIYLHQTIFGKTNLYYCN